MLTSEQLMLRKQGIGGSDAAGVCGVSKWATPVSVYLDKVTPFIEEKVNPVFERGNLIESVIKSLFTKKTGKIISEKIETVFDDDHSFLLANIDGYLPREKALVEIKHYSKFQQSAWGEDDTDQIPDDYLIQVQHYLSVTNTNKAYVAALFGDDSVFSLLASLVKKFGSQGAFRLIEDHEFDLRIFTVQRNDRLIKKIKDIEIDFWLNHVQKKTPPQWKTREDLTALFPESTPREVIASAEDIEAANFIKAKNDEIKRLEKEVEAKKSYLCGKLANASCLRDGEGNKIATWKSQLRSSFNMDSFKEKYPDLFQMFSTSKQSRVLRF